MSPVETITRSIEVMVFEGKLYDPEDDERLPAGHDGALIEIEVEIEYDFEPAGGDGWNEPRHSATCSITRAIVNDTGAELPEHIVESHSEEWEQEALNHAADRLYPYVDEDTPHSQAMLNGAMRRYRRMFA